MNENNEIKLVKKLDVTDLAGEKVMIDFETGKYFLLKGSANDIWDIISAEESAMKIEDIIQKLLTIYEVEYDVCKTSVLQFLTNLQEYQFIEVA